MAVKHTVLFNFKEGTDEGLVQQVVVSLNRLPSVIPEVQSWEIAEDLGKRESSFRFVLLATFADMDALERYLKHPDHEDAVTRAAPHLSQIAEHDYVS